MAGRLAIDFGNEYTVAAYWRQAAHQAETLYLPGVTRPMSGCGANSSKKMYAAPSLLAYDGVTGDPLIGQEARESRFAQQLFHDLQFAVVTGKRVNVQTGSQLRSSQDMAKDYLAAVLGRAGQVLGLGSEAVIAFTVPLAVCQTPKIWQRYYGWLTAVINQAGFKRLELIEQPWAAAWGAGMKVQPEARYIVLTINEEYLEAAMVQVANLDAADSVSRRLRVLSYCGNWLTESEVAAQLPQTLADNVRQLLREADLLGYRLEGMAGVVVTGSAVDAAVLTTIRELFDGLVIYADEPLTAAACGAAVLSAGIDGCGYLLHSYGLRYVTEAGYHYREIVPQGMFYPSDGPVVTVRASYDGQQQFALLLYRRQEQCINEDKPLLLTSVSPAVKGQPVMTVQFRVDGAGQLVVTARDAVSQAIVADNKVAAKLV